MWKTQQNLLLLAGILLSKVLFASVPSSFVTLDPFEVALQPEIVGAKSSFNFYNNDFAVIRFTEDGLPDPVLDKEINPNVKLSGVITTNFNNLNIDDPANRTNNDVANSCIVTPERKIVAAGFATLTTGLKKIALARYNPDGSLDVTFNRSQRAPIPGLLVGMPGTLISTLGNSNDIATGIILDSDGKYVFVGDTQTPEYTNGYIERLNPDGLADPTFNATGTTAGGQLLAVDQQDTHIHCVTQDSSGRYLVVGTSDFAIFIARLNNDGTFDTTFNPAGTTPGIVLTTVANRNAEGWVIIEDPDIEKILVGALLVADSGLQEVAVLRYNQNGSLDTTFNGSGIVQIPTPLYEERALSMQLESEALSGNIILNQFGKNIIRQENSVIRPQLVNTLLRITRQGKLDETFNPTGESIIFTPAQVLVNNPADPGNIAVGDARFFGFSQTHVTSIALNPLGLAGYEALDISAVLNFTPTIVSSNTVRSDLVQIPDDVTSGILIDPQSNYIAAGFSNNSNFNNNFFFLRVHRDGTANFFFNLVPAKALALVTNPFKINTFFNITFTEFGGTSQNYLVSPFQAEQIGQLLFANPEQFQAITTLPHNASIFTTPDVNFEGMAPPDSIITLYLNNGVIGTVKSDLIGHWKFSTKISEDGSYDFFTSVQTKGAGDRPPYISKNIYFAVATKLPDVPKITLPKERTTFDTNSLEFEGTAAPGAEVQLYSNEKLFGTVQADDKGAWRLYQYFPNAGLYTIEARVIDSLGRMSGLSNAVIIKKIYKETQELSITSPGIEEVVNTSEVMITGTGPAQSRITLVLNGKNIATIDSNAQGNWSYKTQALKEGEYTLIATVYDAMHKNIQHSTEVPFAVRSSTSASSIAKPTLTLDVAINSSVLISGHAEPNAIANIFINRKPLGSTSVSKKGIWSYVIPANAVPSVGKYPIEVSILDKAGNAGNVSTLFLNFTQG